MKKYDWVLFDADETLFHFDSFTGLKCLFAKFGVDFTKQDYDEYEQINKPLWVLYQKGEITVQEIVYRRFKKWVDRLEVTAEDLNSEYMVVMADVCVPIDGALELLCELKHNQIKLGIITNGMISLQKARLEKTKLIDFFDVLVISEQVGASKPNIAIFEYAFNLMRKPEKNKVLMIGDNLESDILGGNNFGIDTCWFNLNNKLIIKNIIPKYQTNSLHKISELIGLS